MRRQDGNAEGKGDGPSLGPGVEARVMMERISFVPFLWRCAGSGRGGLISW
jgi:hypothetical protein